ncbi:hypothetical protein PLEOSDRAFT_1110771 [Pleurotus ostreatus PC15]|uniref:RAM signaling network component n=1 Tax=Pleurotus ostreatus (strain PC15) TaxID=1137138 RepID=A0A067P0R0_PLEO1|nr:hypothetical protein PLEOSDRAFT_1110771 [Pleurotus ostreatus PC15]
MVALSYSDSLGPHSQLNAYTFTSLSNYHISEAVLKSPDNGSTLDLSRQHITAVEESGVEELASVGRDEEDQDSQGSVLRIALGHNKLSTLPPAFSLLSRLRYLNLKSNSFDEFPDVLTNMPSLDTLDISHNQIKRLPVKPGTLVNLRVFCLSRNRLSRIPTYLSRFNSLEIFKVDRNPIEWPPREVTSLSHSVDSADSMKDWIISLQRWLDDDEMKLNRVHDDSGFVENDLEHHIEEDLNSWSQLPASASEFDAGITPHARNFSVDSAFSMSSASESFQEVEPPSLRESIALERPPPLHLGILQAYSTETSPAHSPNAYLPSPAASDASPPRSNGIYGDSAQQHGRTSSYADLNRPFARSDLIPKQSMPDLRTAKLNFTKKRPDGPPPTKEEFSMPSPLSLRQDSNSSLNSNTRGTSAEASSSKLGPGPSMAFERNSYFRRLSTLPTAVSTVLPQPLLCLIDSARSILFAVCQVYLALEHYTVQATDDRLPNVLRKVLDPANSDMMHFINSLDRFDAMSRKMLPPPAICRAVVESCKDTVSVFGKAMGVLALQLKMLAHEDVRYLRSLLLTLYGATAEISCAWAGMAPHIEAIKPLLYAKPPSSNHLAAISNSEAYPLSAPVTKSTHGHEGSGAFPPLRSANGTTGVVRARRHAGSFSSKDVEIGKALPSYEDMPSPFGGVVPGAAPRTPIPRKNKRQTTAPNPTLTTTSVVISSPSPTAPPESMPVVPSFLAEALRPSHSRQGSQASLQGSSTSSSPLVAPKPSLSDLASTSKVQVDNEVLNAMQEAIDVAPSVWEMMEEILADVINTDTDVREGLARAKAITTRLSQTLRAFQDGDFTTADKRAMGEDARIFCNSVVQLSRAIKYHGGAHAVPPSLRLNMVKLTNATEVFLILLHVSSFSPSATPRSYSPMLSASLSASSALNPPPSTSGLSSEESRLGFSLSRSRSAQPSPSMRHRFQEPPRSALPTQTFKVPSIRRRGRDPPFDTAFR